MISLLFAAIWAVLLYYALHWNNHFMIVWSSMGVAYNLGRL